MLWRHHISAVCIQVFSYLYPGWQWQAKLILTMALPPTVSDLQKPTSYSCWSLRFLSNIDQKLVFCWDKTGCHLQGKQYFAPYRVWRSLPLDNLLIVPASASVDKQMRYLMLAPRRMSLMGTAQERFTQKMCRMLQIVSWMQSEKQKRTGKNPFYLMYKIAFINFVNGMNND